jgi:hypothetical protein
MSFELLKWEPVRIRHVNLRGEKHGEETVSALDIKVELPIENRRLDMFHPELCDKTYFNREAQQGQLAMDEVPETLPNLIFPQMKAPRKWDLELKGARVVFDYGLGEERGSNIDLHGSKVKGFELEMIEGGTVNVVFTIQNNEFPDGALDKLRHKLDQELPVLIVPAGAFCELLVPVAEPKEPPKPKPPRANSNKVIDFPVPKDVAPDAPPTIDPAQLTITQAMEAASPAADAPKARGSRNTPTSLE